MKAYQLKIMIKNSKPPIWRRCTVPAGITFSQLGVVLNEVMGWTGYHLSAFEFYHLKLRFEEMEDDFDTWWDYDIAESSEHVIDQYMESEDWFTYTYDFGDDWTHRVTIENVLPDFQYNYPVVIKFKGNCPPEDCGGIEGYYQLSENGINDTGNLDEEMNSQRELPTEEDYDMAEINEMFAKNFQIQYVAKEETRRKDELYDEFVVKSGTSLKAVRNGNRVNTRSKIITSRRHQTDDILQKIADMMNLYADSENMKNLNKVSEMYGSNNLVKEEDEETLEEIFNSYTKKDLQEIARFHSIKYFSSYNKVDLIKNTIETIMDKNMFTSYFACLRDTEIDAFMRALDGNLEYEDFKYEIDRIYFAGYCTVTEDDYVLIPSEVKTAFNEINTESFHKIRKRRSAVLDCFIAADFLYGSAPLGVISTMLRNYTGSAYLIGDIIAESDTIPYCLRDFTIMEEEYIAFDLLHNKQLDNLHALQWNKEYYIPTYNEILELASQGYIRSEKTIRKLQNYLVEKMYAPFEDAVTASRNIQREIMMGGKMQKIYDILESCSIRAQSQKQLNELVSLINELWNNTRMISNRGFAPNELIKEERKFLKPLPNDKVIDFQQAKRSKVYPNDMCPCGSGKKYKHCCGCK